MLPVELLKRIADTLMLIACCEQDLELVRQFLSEQADFNPQLIFDSLSRGNPFVDTSDLLRLFSAYSLPYSKEDFEILIASNGFSNTNNSNNSQITYPQFLELILPKSSDYLRSLRIMISRSLATQEKRTTTNNALLLTSDLEFALIRVIETHITHFHRIETQKAVISKEFDFLINASLTRKSEAGHKNHLTFPEELLRYMTSSPKSASIQDITQFLQTFTVNPTDEDVLYILRRCDFDTDGRIGILDIDFAFTPFQSILANPSAYNKFNNQHKHTNLEISSANITTHTLLRTSQNISSPTKKKKNNNNFTPTNRSTAKTTHNNKTTPSPSPLKHKSPNTTNKQQNSRKKLQSGMKQLNKSDNFFHSTSNSKQFNSTNKKQNTIELIQQSTSNFSQSTFLHNSNPSQKTLQTLPHKEEHPSIDQPSLQNQQIDQKTENIKSKQQKSYIEVQIINESKQDNVNSTNNSDNKSMHLIKQQQEQKEKEILSQQRSQQEFKQSLRAQILEEFSKNKPAIKEQKRILKELKALQCANQTDSTPLQGTTSTPNEINTLSSQLFNPQISFAALPTNTSHLINTPNATTSEFSRQPNQQSPKPKHPETLQQFKAQLDEENEKLINQRNNQLKDILSQHHEESNALSQQFQAQRERHLKETKKQLFNDHQQTQQYLHFHRSNESIAQEIGSYKEFKALELEEHERQFDDAINSEIQKHYIIQSTQLNNNNNNSYSPSSLPTLEQSEQSESQFPSGSAAAATEGIQFPTNPRNEQQQLHNQSSKREYSTISSPFRGQVLRTYETNSIVSVYKTAVGAAGTTITVRGEEDEQETTPDQVRFFNNSRSSCKNMQVDPDQLLVEMLSYLIQSSRELEQLIEAINSCEDFNLHNDLFALIDTNNDKSIDFKTFKTFFFQVIEINNSIATEDQLQQFFESLISDVSQNKLNNTKTHVLLKHDIDKIFDCTNEIANSSEDNHPSRSISFENLSEQTQKLITSLLTRVLVQESDYRRIKKWLDFEIVPTLAAQFDRADRSCLLTARIIQKFMQSHSIELPNSDVDNLSRLLTRQRRINQIVVAPSIMPTRHINAPGIVVPFSS